MNKNPQLDALKYAIKSRKLKLAKLQLDRIERFKKNISEDPEKYDKLTLTQMFRIAHTFGIDLINAAISNKLKDKSLPISFYRNYYQTVNDNIFEELILLGYAEKTKHIDMEYYYVTESGEKQFRKQFAETIIYKPKKERDLQYLKNRINFYCSYMCYRFCDDNSEHIISAYLNYYIKKYKVSHTTNIVIHQFKSELAFYYKSGLLA